MSGGTASSYGFFFVTVGVLTTVCFVPMTGLLTISVSGFVPTVGVVIVSVLVPILGG